jgi:hypothetical protein
MSTVTPIVEDPFEIFKYVKAIMGYPVIEIEVTDEQLELFLKNSLETYSRLIPLIKWFSIAASPGVQEYTLDQGDMGNGIVDVMIPRIDPIAPLMLSSGPRLDIFGYRYSYPYRDISELYIDYMYFTEATKILSSDFQWDYRDGKLLITPKPDEPFTLSFAAAHPRDMASIPASDIDWIRMHVLAQTEIAVGRVRRKYRIPGSHSEQVLDGAVLVQEGMQRLMAMEAELMKRTPDFGPMRTN